VKQHLSPWKLRVFRLRTAVVVAVLVAVGVVFEGLTGGIGSIVIGVLLLRYLAQRDRELLTLKWEYYEGEEGKVRESVESAIRSGNDVLLDGMIRDSSYFGISNPPVLCRTCQTEYRFDTVPSLCWSLRDKFPHDPMAEPPVLNPFRWYWLTSRGYPMPPSWHTITKPWLPMSATEDYPDVAMAAEGRRYYEDNPNPLWEAGFGVIPDWYKLRGHIAA
jgi:hypothetical protein